MHLNITWRLFKGVIITIGILLLGNIVFAQVKSSTTVIIRIDKNAPAALPFMPDLLDDNPQVEEEYRLRAGENVKEKIFKNLLARLDVNKKTCYEGEPIVATYKLCSRLRSESKIIKRPSLDGFSVYDMVEPRRGLLTIEKINGKNFNVHLIRQTQLFPLQAGTYTLDPVELENRVQFVRLTSSPSSNNGSSIERMLDRFFNEEETIGETEEHTMSLKSNSATITVKPLPAKGRPSSFDGAVGKFAIEAGIKNKTITTEDVVELEVVIKGKGNLPVINAPDINLPEGMEPFDPLTKEDIDKTTYPLSGSKTFTYSFLAHKAGDFVIPAISFSYFDPKSASYKTIASDSFAVHVKEEVKRNKANDTIRSSQGTKKTVVNAANTSSHGLLISASVIILVLAAGAIYFTRRKKEA